MIEPPAASLSRDALRRGLATANIPVLLLVLFQVTGDRRWLRGPFRPRRNEGLGDNSTGGLSEQLQDEVRHAAFDAISRYRDGASLAVPSPSPDLLVEMLSTSMGEAVPREYGPMIADELGVTDEAAAFGTLHPPAGFEVLIIGAGLSGIAAASALKRAGVPFQVVERQSDVGGTWLQNRYPGCGVDTPSAIYSFSFRPWKWSKYFAMRGEVLSYLRDSAQAADVYPHISFGEEVVSAIFDAQAQRWRVETRRPDGAVTTRFAAFVISAAGAFSRPKMPEIPGLAEFTGRCVHTADWPPDVELAGRRVAVIGAGASAMQVVPAIADQVGKLSVFQRVPHWVAPFEQFGADVPADLQALTDAVPLYRNWYRIRWGWTFNDRLYSALQKDPQWEHPERSVNAENDRQREYFTHYIKTELRDRPDLVASVVPDYPPFGKRILLDNGWYRTLARDNVELITERIARVAGDELITESGRAFAVDVIICATGFDVVQFLAPMDIRGRSGRSIREAWDGDDARAYLGMAVPDFPNFFMLYGPNIQPGHGGSIVGLAEIQVHYIVDMLSKMFDKGIATVECREDVWREYNDRVDAAHENMIWTHPGMTTYYRNSRGRVVVPGPFRVIDVWHMARIADLEDYQLTTGSAIQRAGTEEIPEVTAESPFQ
jgi:4-hydroxyacetophenone monooxygenase